MNSLEATKVPIEQVQADGLATLFASPGWLTLREILSAHCAEAQAAYLDASMYDTQGASDKAKEARLVARRYNSALDVLDWIQEKREEWYRITLEQRR